MSGNPAQTQQGQKTPVAGGDHKSQGRSAEWSLPLRMVAPPTWEGIRRVPDLDYRPQV